MSIDEKVSKVVSFLNDNKCKNVVSMDVRGTSCDWADFYILATLSSVGHLRGVAKDIWGFLADNDIQVNNRQKTVAEDGWTLIDCFDFVIHLMSEEMRDFYNIEKLWQKPERNKDSK